MVATWLAVLAILVQTMVPDFAMAARAIDRQKADITVVLQSLLSDQGAAQLRYSGCTTVPDESTPASRHQREDLCAFCLALSTHGAPPGAGIGPTLPVRYGTVVSADRPGIQPPRLFLTSSKPRAPPAVERV